MRWRIELSCDSCDCLMMTFHFVEILQCNFIAPMIIGPGKDNAAADTVSRIHCSAITNKTRQDLHHSWCHPGVRRMAYFVRCRIPPFSIKDAKRMSAYCPGCAELKPKFHAAASGTLIKATSPFHNCWRILKVPVYLSMCWQDFSNGHEISLSPVAIAWE